MARVTQVAEAESGLEPSSRDTRLRGRLPHGAGWRGRVVVEKSPLVQSQAVPCVPAASAPQTTEWTSRVA